MVKGQFLWDDRVLNAIHMHVACEMFYLKGDIKVAIVQENVQRASTAILVTT